MKYFNLGNVWGKIASVKLEKSTNSTPYLSITLEVSNPMFGNIKTYGRLWGQVKIDAFMDYFKDNPGSAYRFQGFFSQYTKNGNRLSNYTFFSWQPFIGTEFRTAFILKGEVTAIEKDKIFLHIERKGKGEYEDIPEDFEIYALDVSDLAGIKVGDLIQAKGCIRYKESEDYFGGSPQGQVRPYCMEIKQVEAF